MIGVPVAILQDIVYDNFLRCKVVRPDEGFGNWQGIGGSLEKNRDGHGIVIARHSFRLGACRGKCCGEECRRHACGTACHGYPAPHVTQRMPFLQVMYRKHFHLYNSAKSLSIFVQPDLPSFNRAFTVQPDLQSGCLFPGRLQICRNRRFAGTGSH